jgi:hypothetical protein
MKLQELKIKEDDFDVFVELSPRAKIEFLSDAITGGVEASICKQIDRLGTQMMKQTEPVIATDDFHVGKFRLSVTMIQNEVHLNSNSLKAIRKFTAKLWNDGFLLSRLDFKKTELEIYRYYRVYKIIGKGHPFSSN